MPRIRLTREEMRDEAIRLASEFVAQLPYAESARFKGAGPDTSSPTSDASKFPIVWNVAFVFHPPDVVMDGGELFVTVNVETGAVTLCE